METKRFIRTLAVIAATGILVACSAGKTPEETPTELTLITHGSFSLADGTFDKFTADTGITVKFHELGSAGEIVNAMNLTKNNPVGDVVWGIDNVFGAQAIQNGIISEYSSPLLTAHEAPFLLKGFENWMTPVTSGDICLNYDDIWFAEHDSDYGPPTSLDDLKNPYYGPLIAIPAASTSSVGVGFMLATIAQFGESGYEDFWKQLIANGATITSGWSEAYYGEFTAGGEGDKPIVVSYGSSPAYAPTTRAVANTCFAQVEYAGLVAGTKYPTAAKQLIDYLLSDIVQQQIPEEMYVFPVTDVALPDYWEENALKPGSALNLDSALISQKRSEWLQAWTEIVFG